MTAKKQIIFLKNKTIPRDKYESISKDYYFEHVNFVPLIEHTNHPDEITSLFTDSQYLQELEYIIVTSQRTVECLYEDVIPHLSESVKNELFNKIVYTVGPATGEFLRRCGFQNVRGDDMGNGSKLADMMVHDLNKSYRGEILFLVGVIRTDVIKNKLNSKGFNVKEVVTYETKPMHNNLERLQRLVNTTCCTWIVVFSPQGMDEIIKYLKNYSVSNNDVDIKVSCIGPTTQSFLIKKGVIPCVVSPRPTAPALLEAINDHGEET